MSCKVTKKSFNNDLKNLILDNNWESLGIKSNLDTSNSKPTTYVDRVEIFVPFDSSNPNKDILFGKLKNLESQINKVYQSGEYGNVIQTQMKSDGGVISIQSTDKLLNALNEQYSGEQDPSGNVKEFKSWVGNKSNSQNSQERLNAIQEVFNSNPELSKIGDVFSYAIYLDTIFPDSKVAEINNSLYISVLNQLEQENKIEKDCTGGGKIKAEKGLQTNFTKGGKWRLIKDLKGYPTHKEGGVDLTIGKNGVSIKNGNTEFTAKHGLVIPKN